MENMTKKDLLQVCKTKGITSVNSKSSKEDIVKALKQHAKKVDSNIKKGTAFADEH